jgi:hypothetical protein
MASRETRGLGSPTGYSRYKHPLSPHDYYLSLTSALPVDD